MYDPTILEKINYKQIVYDYAIENGHNEKTAEEFVLRACNGEKWVQRKFFEFLDKNKTDEIWERDDLFPLMEKIIPTNRNLRKLVKRIYDYRSRNLHSGQDFPISVFVGMSHYVPIGFNPLEKDDDSYFPPIIWFERVVHTALRTFLEKSVSSM